MSYQAICAIPNESKARGKEFEFLKILANYADSRGYITYSFSYIATQERLSLDTVRRRFKRLGKLGELIKIREGCGRERSLYQIAYVEERGYTAGTAPVQHWKLSMMMPPDPPKEPGIRKIEPPQVASAQTFEPPQVASAQHSQVARTTQALKPKEQVPKQTTTTNRQLVVVEKASSAATNEGQNAEQSTELADLLRFLCAYIANLTRQSAARIVEKCRTAVPSCTSQIFT